VKDNVRGLNAVENSTSEGCVRMLWIWQTHDGSQDHKTGHNMQEGKSFASCFTDATPADTLCLALCIEWCKALMAGGMLAA
jgi:hypothetical protein